MVKSFKVPEEKSPRCGLLRRLFADRDVVVTRSSGTGRPRHVRIGAGAQAFLSVALVAVIGGLAWAYVSAVVTIRRLEADQDARRAIETLAGMRQDLAIYKEHLDRMRVRLDHNYGQLVVAMGNAKTDAVPAPVASRPGDKETVAIVNHLKAVLEAGREASNPRHAIREQTDERAAALLAERARLNGEIEFLADELGRLVDGAARQSDSKTVHKAVIQRDLAAFEAKELRAKVAGLESMVTDMQAAQIMVFEKVGTLADGGIKTVERKLSDIKDVMNSVGLGFEWLVSRAREDREDPSTGQGGPLIPVSIGAQAVPTMKSEHFKRAYSNVNSQVQRWDGMARLLDRLPLGLPVRHVRITSGFGVRQDPLTSGRSVHEGLDFAGMRGETVVATAPGRVTYAGSAGSFGLMVEVDHGMGVKTRFAHLNAIDVMMGDNIVHGQKIGEIGSTGRSTGPHLHYEVRIRGRAVNPWNFAKTRR